MAGAIARLGREGRAAFGRRFDSCLPHVNCFKCFKTLESAFGKWVEDHGDDSKATHQGLLFAARGNYGSRVWDPTMSAPDLVIWICDDCIIAHKELVQLRDYATVRTEILWSDFDPEKAYW